MNSPNLWFSNSYYICEIIKLNTSNISPVQFSSVTQSCPTDPMNHSMPGLPIHHQLPEFTQTHVHRAGDAIQPSHPLLSPSPLAPNPSQHQSLFQWVNSSHEVAKVAVSKLMMDFEKNRLFSVFLGILESRALGGVVLGQMGLLNPFPYSFISSHYHFKTPRGKKSAIKLLMQI